jgi:hypothetical protein
MRGETALKSKTSAGSGARFGPTSRRSADRRRFDNLPILEGVAEKGVNSLYTYRLGQGVFLQLNLGVDLLQPPVLFLKLLETRHTRGVHAAKL